MSAVEYLDILDASFRYTGTAPRDEAHDKGLIHRVAHIWVVSVLEGVVWVWFQQRAHDKKDFPSLYDIAVGGHVDAGEPVPDAAVREMREEIGLHVQPEELGYLGAYFEESLFPGFTDRELCETYVYQHPSPPFAPGEEVVQLARVPLSELVRTACGTSGELTLTAASGEQIATTPDNWCKHAGEFQELFLPWLAEQGLYCPLK